jgi:hypothetical protein
MRHWGVSDARDYFPVNSRQGEVDKRGTDSVDLHSILF